MITKAAEELLSEYKPQGACEVAVPMTLPGTPTDNVTTASNNVATSEAGAKDFGPDCEDENTSYGRAFKEGFRTAFEMFHPETVVKEAMCACGKDESECHCPTEYTGDQDPGINKKTETPIESEKGAPKSDGHLETVDVDNPAMPKEAACACGEANCDCKCPTQDTGDQPVNVNKKTENAEQGKEQKAPENGPMEMVNEADAESKIAALRKNVQWVGF